MIPSASAFSPPSLLRGVALAGLFVASATVFKLALVPLLGSETPFLIYFLAVLLSAWYGGRWAGLAATGLAAVVADYFFIPPTGSFSVLVIGQWVQLGLFLGEGALISWITSDLQDARRHAETNAALMAQREEELRRSEERFRLALKGSRIVVFNHDRELRYIWDYNDIFENVIGKRDSKLWERPEEGQRLEALKRDVLISGDVFHGEVSMHVAGQPRVYDLHVEPLRDSHGSITGLTCVAIDITDRKQAEAERLALLERERASRIAAERSAARIARLQIVTSELTKTLTPAQAAEVIVQASMTATQAQAGVVQRLSADGTALEMLYTRGYPEDLIAAYQRMPMSLNVPGTEVVRTRQPYWRTAKHELLAQYPHMAEAVARNPYEAVTVLPLLVGERVIGVMAVSFTEQREFDAEEKDFLLTLAQQCAQAMERARLYEAEHEARRQAEEAVKLRDLFFSVAAHELKTPLTALYGNAQILQRRLRNGDGSDPRHLTTVEVVISQAERLNKMISALLDVARFEQGQLVLQCAPLDLAQLVRRVIDDMQPTLRRHTLVLDDETDGGVMIQGDAVRLEQVLHNLISNGVKYSPAGGEIRVRVAREESGVCLQVRDHGIGIPDEAIPHLFTRFYRAPNAEARKISGLGIGLFMVKEIIHRHGGTVTVESHEGEGSAFTVYLPPAVG